MTPLQTSSDPEVADWEKPLGGVFQAPTGTGIRSGDVERRRPRRRLGPASWSGVVPGAGWDRRPSGRR